MARRLTRSLALYPPRTLRLAVYPTPLAKEKARQHNNNIYLGKRNQAARKGTGPSKLATQKSNKENTIHAQKKHTEQKIIC